MGHHCQDFSFHSRSLPHYNDEKLAKESWISLVDGLIKLCAKGGFPLTKFISNCPAVLESLPSELRAEGFKDPAGNLPETSMLGVCYKPEEDTFRVKIPPKSGGGVWTRKKVLSVVMSFFDPLGQVSPYVLYGKKFNQRLCALKLDWEDPIPEDMNQEVDQWFDQKELLQNLVIQRSFGLTYFGQTVTLHIFTDASTIGYGAVGFFVINDTLKVVWISARSRVSPVKESNVDVNGSIPRLELQAAVTGVELATQIREDIDVTITREVYHTDSTTVYFWIQNLEAKHPVFVANRLSRIRLAIPDSPPLR